MRGFSQRCERTLSTHDLTQRSTSFRSPHNYARIFQLTTSRRGRPRFYFPFLHFLFFQLTTSRRGRRYPHYSNILSVSFNSRPHAEVDLRCCRPNVHTKSFQLTTSRRGRQAVVQPLTDQITFQLTTSRRGRLVPFFLSFHIFCLSTHDLTQRSTFHVGWGVFY